MSDTPTDYRDLPEGECLWIVPPNVSAMMTGVKWATQDRNGLVTLTYADDTTESAPLPLHTIGQGELDTIFAIVSRVQHIARQGTPSESMVGGIRVIEPTYGDS